MPPTTASSPVHHTVSELRRRRLLVVAGLGVLLVLTALASLAVGARPIAPGAVWQALWAPTGTEEDVIVRGLRVPRTVLGVAVGIALGVAGALVQGHTRNPLADPGLLGVSAGAALAVVVGIFLFDVTSLVGYVWFAFVGAFAASVAVFLLARSGRAVPRR